MTTQREYAKQLGVHYTHLNAVLRGRYRCSAKLAKKIEELMGVPAYKLRPDIFDRPAKK